ncbi:AfsR/SARP family transcriptional regulator [Streptomyces pseudovenezuelae]|uniref:AfsR/SARP family transcriptional regulator n=1 Tax=Streptomyces pseudovenezuelae TaxID=67350 RepID=A0ABZ1X0Z1_9ACTN|nr:AfsR/SARP family transcriptional regulator [Streptomyces pseudovenezuelae]
MNIQLLGCIELHAADRKLVSISPAVGLLLAALAWSPNAFVSDQDVIDRIWEARPPLHPRNALYTLATRLRKALHTTDTEHGSCDVVRRQSGYVLAVKDETVDTYRFRALAREARSLAFRGEQEAALNLYEEAAAQWHGDPLCGIDATWAEAARATLRHEWRSVLLTSAELGLRLNRHNEYLPQLHDLVVLHPHDERAAGLLMLALYQSGRVDEALLCFQTIRSKLIDALGDEPGPELRALHERILLRNQHIPSDPPRLDTLIRESTGTLSTV